MRRRALLLALTFWTFAACGPTVLIEGEIAAGGVGAGLVGTGANGTGANGVGASGTGANGWGAGPGTGASSGNGASSGTGAGSGMPLDQWAKAFGEKGHQHLRALASRPSGEIVVAGYFDGALAFESDALPAKGLRSGFVAELGPKGDPLWSTLLVGDDCAVEAIAIDDAGGVVLTGFVKGSLAIDGSLVSTSDGIVVAKLDKQGSVLWAKTFGSSANMQADRGLGIASSPSGFFVSGSYAGAIDFGGSPLPPTGGAFVAAFDTSGGPLWSKQLGGTQAFVASEEGRALLGVNGDDKVMKVLALDGASGVELWSHAYAPAVIGAIGTSPSGDVLFTGSTTSADFGGGPLVNPLPDGEAFVVALDANGNHRWTKGVAFDVHQSTGRALTIDASGTVAATGSYVHHVDEGSVIQSAFVIALDTEGATLGIQTFGPIDGYGSKVTQEGWGISSANSGGFYVGGDFYTAIAVAGSSLSGEGSSDLFVAKLPAP